MVQMQLLHIRLLLSSEAALVLALHSEISGNGPLHHDEKPGDVCGPQTEEAQPKQQGSDKR